MSAALEVARALPRTSPVTIVFVSAPFVPLLANWLGFARRAGATNILAIALDRETERAAEAMGIAHSSFPRVRSTAKLWVARADLFAALARTGIDFIHSDADAVWLHAPIDEAFAANVDISFSGGTIWPRSVVDRWGFVACCGFFAARGTPAAGAFFTEVATRTRKTRDDQIAVNEALVDAGVIWGDTGAGKTRVQNGISFRVFPQTLVGRSASLRVALLPHRLFSRLPEVTPETLVAHPVSPKTPGSHGIGRHVRTLKQLGLWQPPETASAAWIASARTQTQ